MSYVAYDILVIVTKLHESYYIESCNQKLIEHVWIMLVPRKNGNL